MVSVSVDGVDLDQLGLDQDDIAGAQVGALPGGDGRGRDGARAGELANRGDRGVERAQDILEPLVLRCDAR